MRSFTSSTPIDNLIKLDFCVDSSFGYKLLFSSSRECALIDTETLSEGDPASTFGEGSLPL